MSADRGTHSNFGVVRFLVVCTASACFQICLLGLNVEMTCLGQLLGLGILTLGRNLLGLANVLVFDIL